MSDAVVNEADSLARREQDRRGMVIVAILSAAFFLSTLILIWPYGFAPALATLAITGVAAVIICCLMVTDPDENITKKMAIDVALISGMCLPPLVVLYTIASKWGGLFEGVLGMILGPTVGILAVFAGIAGFVFIFLQEEKTKKGLRLYLAFISAVAVLTIFTASFTPSGVLRSSDNKIMYTTAPQFNLPWMHELPMERPTLEGAVTIEPDEPTGWKAEIEYSVPDPSLLSSDDWKRYRSLQSGPYVFLAFHDTDNPAEAVRHGFLTQYPFLHAEVKVTKTTQTVWASPSQQDK